MEVQKSFEKMKSIEINLLDYIDDESNNEDSLQKVITFLNDYIIRDNKYELELLIQLLVTIINNHHRGPNFFSKIEQIIYLFKSEIKNYFSSSEIFRFFQENKRILLYLFEQQILKFDEQIAHKITDYSHLNYPQFFAPELKPFLNEEFKKEWQDRLIDEEYTDLDKYIDIEISDEFYEKRKIGENDNYICELIRKDMAAEFISYINQRNITSNYIIPESIFENNIFFESYLEIQLIEYAAFHGSIQIIQYFLINGVELEQSLWNFAIHSNNAELIALLEKNDLMPDDTFIFRESMKCHHYDIFNYIKNKYFENMNPDEDAYTNDIFLFYNFALIIDNLNIDDLFFLLCENNYFVQVEIILNKKDKDFIIKDINKIFF